MSLSLAGADRARGLCILAIAAGAYAYFTTTGSGTATATVGTSSAVTLKGTVTGNLYPGSSSPVTLTVDNPSTGKQRVGTVSLEKITADAGHASCSVVITGGNPFSIELRGQLEELYPGYPPQPVSVLVTNPNSVAIEVTSLTVAIADEPQPCPAENFALTPSSASPAAPSP